MKAVICGAGIAGLSLAQRLSSIGWDVAVIEKSAGPRDQGYHDGLLRARLRRCSIHGIATAAAGTQLPG
ncbi:MAG TPA: FAD-dependent oxidoreductase [Pseudonocardiaceae bacterium]|nr:FAD-dependent oxidoreductase [Pseudonocardiaceae bacterium]